MEQGVGGEERGRQGGVRKEAPHITMALGSASVPFSDIGHSTGLCNALFPGHFSSEQPEYKPECFAHE